jgi:hypothetical protein
MAVPKCLDRGDQQNTCDAAKNLHNPQTFQPASEFHHFAEAQVDPLIRQLTAYRDPR